MVSIIRFVREVHHDRRPHRSILRRLVGLRLGRQGIPGARLDVRLAWLLRRIFHLPLDEIMTRVSDLAGAELALWVARALKLEASIGNDGLCYLVPYGPMAPAYAPHEIWEQGGPLIESHLIEIAPHDDGWIAMMFNSEDSPVPLVCMNGETPLIAAMRALVASVYGAEVQA